MTGGWATPEPTAYDSSVDRSSPSVAQSAADVSGALTPRAAEISADIYRLIVREIPQLRGDKRVLALLEASVEENVTTMLHVMQHGIDLEKVRAPTLVIAREGDDIHPADVARTICELMPNAELMMFPDGKAMYEGIPAIVQRVRDFLIA